MNNMETQLNNLAESVGDFIRYWGFRRIHGQLWTQIYLSNQPLSGAELTKNLKVSKALVSPALEELIQHGLIKSHKIDLKTKKYTAVVDVASVIKNILQKREQVLIKKAYKNCQAVKKKLSTDKSINTDRLSSLEDMISTADGFLALIMMKEIGNL
jgi:DNA-binding transcriptional regulator GbsR (MarR family)